MGKNKQSQRTKNNARPSNSRRSAELLGSSLSNFVGFSAARDGGYVPTLPGLALFNISEVEMSNVDSNFQIVLRKMNKKDPTTKCKALQEFANMCRESELSSVEGMLSFWPRLYCALAVEGVHRVREAAQLAHAAVAKRVGKNIAVYLKQVAGPWFTSQYDTYPPAASAAQNSFNETFPPKKVVDAIIHCQREILTYICDNLTTKTAQTLSEQKFLSEEEMEAKYQKVVISNLRAYSSYLKKVPREEIEKMADIHQKIISSNKFWKFVQHESYPIKTAFFNVLTAIIEHSDVLLKEERKRTVTAIMNSLDETDPGLLSAVWESMLVAVNKIEDWYSVVSIEKLVLPKLWRVLRSGGQCCASTIYPNLLPFISQFPKLNLDINNLYTNFFNNMRQGFSVKSVQMSRAEMSAVATSFIECLRYSILLNADNQPLCTGLLKDQLIPAVEGCLKENTPLKNILFCETTHLLRYWSKNRDSTEYPAYSHLMTEFWKELGTLSSNLIDASQNAATFNTPDCNAGLIEFILNLKNAPVYSRKNLKVKFIEPEENASTDAQMKNPDIEADSQFLRELNDFVNSLCITYFQKITEQKSKKYIVHLNKLVTSFEYAEFFAALSKSLRTEINFFNVYHEILREWLVEKSDDREHIVKLIFNIIKYMSDSEKNEIVNLLMQLDDTVINRSVIQCYMSKPNRNDVILRKWCTKSKVSQLLVNVAKEVALDNYQNLEINQNLILLAFESFDDGELLMEETGIREIVSILYKSLDKIEEPQFLSFAKLISNIVLLTWSQPRLKPAATQVLEMLFKFITQGRFNDDLFVVDMMHDIWKKGILEAVQQLTRTEFIDLTGKLARSIWDSVYESQDENVKDLLVNIAADFIKVITNKDLGLESDYTKEIVLSFLMDSAVNTWMVEATGIVLYGEAVTGRLYISTLDQDTGIHGEAASINLASNTVADNTERCVLWALFNTKLLNILYTNSSDVNTCDNEGNTAQESTHDNRSLVGTVDLLMNVIYSIILGQIYNNYYKSTRHYDNVDKYRQAAEIQFAQIQQYFDDDIYEGILNCILNNYSRYNSMLAYAISFCCSKFQTRMNCEALLQIYKTREDIKTCKERQLQAVEILTNYKYPDDPSQTDEITQLIVARSMFAHSNDTTFDILNKVIHKYYDVVSDKEEDPKHLLLNCDISETPWEVVTFPLEIIRLLTELINKVPEKLTANQWNYVMISIVLWQGTISKSKKNAGDFKVVSLTIAICQLYGAIESSMKKNESGEAPGISDTLYGSWKNVLAAEVQCGIVQTWITYTELYNDKATSLKAVVVLDCLGKAISHLEGTPVFKDQANASPNASLDLDNTINLSLKLLQSSIPSIQLGAYHILKQMVPELVQSDISLVESEKFDRRILTMHKMEDALENMQNIVNALLMDYKSSDNMVSCAIQPYTDSYTYTVGYLLIWTIILEMSARAHPDLRFHYGDVLKEKYFPFLMENILLLMPVEVLQENKSKATKVLEAFSTSPNLSFGVSWTEWRLDHIVCWLHASNLRYLRSLIRMWWNTSDCKVSATVDRITTRYVSPMLTQEELLNTKLVNIENMQIKVHPTAREVVAVYVMDDTNLEVTIVLPPNYPLGPVNVQPGQHADGTPNWRNCHMQLAVYLTYQNGTITDGLNLWKRNLDKKIAGVEECYICFSIFHISTYQIPRISCRTCRKKFHTPCLYKWFSTSQNSSCPLCRNVF